MTGSMVAEVRATRHPATAVAWVMRRCGELGSQPKPDVVPPIVKCSRISDGERPGTE